MQMTLSETYKVFDASGDEIISASEILETILKDHPDFVTVWKEQAHELEQAGDTDISPDASVLRSSLPIRILLDCSGSMRGKRQWSTILAILEVCSHLHTAGRPYEVLGFTTRTWKGGEAHLKWISNGRQPQNPGRLCELRHIIFSEIGDDLETLRRNLSIVFLHGVCKENIDGEALRWVRERAEASHQPGQVLLVSDGYPCDQVTADVNPSNYLMNDLEDVLAQYRAASIPLAAVRIGSAGVDDKTSFPVVEDVPEVDTPSNVVSAIWRALARLA